MDTFKTGTTTPIARAISAEIRSRMAVLRLSTNRMAQDLPHSQNYYAERMRDEKPFSIDDLALIAEIFNKQAAGAGEHTPLDIVLAAERHLEHLETVAALGLMEEADRAPKAKTVDEVIVKSPRARKPAPRV